MSEVKVNKISPRSGTTITLGDSGDTFTVPSGVTFDASSGGLAGTLTTAAQPNITSVGTLTSFTSTGIDDNATSTAITIDSSERVGIGETVPSLGKLVITTTQSFQPLIGLKNEASSGEVGIQFVSDNATPGINYLNFGDTADVNSGQIAYRHNVDAMTFKTNDSERMRITNSGNVGIGTTTPAQALTIGGISSTPGDYKGLAFQSGVSEVGYVRSNVTDGNNIFLTFGTYGSSSLAERMRISSNGKVGINTTSPNFNLHVENNSTETTLQLTNKSNTGNHRIVDFVDGVGTLCGNISIDTGSNSVAYNTSSDYRLKENVIDLADATTRIKQLQPKRFNFIANPNKTFDGFLAHEVSSVVPEAITGTKDAVQVWKEGEELPEGVSVGDNKLDENGNTIPEYQGIDQSKLVPLLVKTIQELEARITQLENA